MSDPSRDRLGVRSFLRAAQERKVWGVAAAYLVVGYGIIEASELIFPRLQFSVSAVDWLLALLLFAFPLALLGSWSLRRDNTSSRVSAVLPVASLLVVSATSAWLGVRVLTADEGQGSVAESSEPSLPIVIMMDSPHPARVYDEETLAANGTNADVISDISSICRSAGSGSRSHPNGTAMRRSCNSIRI